MAIAYVPAVLVTMNLVYAIAAYPAGVLSDRWGRISLLAVGMIFLIVADVILAISNSIPILLLRVIFWGLHMALTQGSLAAMIADTAPEDLRGTAYGVFNLIVGIAMLLASIVAGGLWDVYGPSVAFFAGAASQCSLWQAFGSLLTAQRMILQAADD